MSEQLQGYLLIAGAIVAVIAWFVWIQPFLFRLRYGHKKCPECQSRSKKYVNSYKEPRSTSLVPFQSGLDSGYPDRPVTLETGIKHIEFECLGCGNQFGAQERYQKRYQ